MNNTYCLRCQGFTQDINPKILKSASRRRISSTCANCGGKKSKFIK